MLWKLATVALCAFLVLAEAQQLKNSNAQEDACKAKHKVVADATYCDRYWECVDGQAELYDCPNGLVFAGHHRGVTEGCDYPWRSNYCEDKQLANSPISREHCDWLYGIFGHEASCTRYWSCWNGTATEQLCAGGLLYNDVVRTCDWPENVAGCQKHPLCNDDPNGNAPLEKSCERYWQCQGGYPRLQRCPASLVFDRRSLHCVIPPTEDCDVPTTPQPSPEELEESEEQTNTAPPRPAHISHRPTQHAEHHQDTSNNSPLQRINPVNPSSPPPARPVQQSTHQHEDNIPHERNHPRPVLLHPTPRPQVVSPPTQQPQPVPLVPYQSYQPHLQYQPVPQDTPDDAY